MYRLELSLKIWHSEDGQPYEQVKSLSEKLETGDENHPQLANHLGTMIRRMFERLKELERPTRKIVTPGLVAPTNAQVRHVNRIAGA